MKLLNRSSIVLVLSVASLVVGATACVSDSPQETSTPTAMVDRATPTSEPTMVPEQTPTASPSPTPSGPVALDRDNLELARTLLSYVPDSALARDELWITDYELARSLLGITPPDPDSEEAVEQYVLNLFDLTGLTGGLMTSDSYLAGFYSRNEPVSSRFASRPLVGFAQGDVTQSITWSSVENLREIVLGDIDSESASQGIADCTDCPVYQVNQSGRIPFFVWGDDAERNFRNRYILPLFDGSGAGGRLAVTDGVAWRSLHTESMRTMLATAEGEHASLVDDDDYVDLVRVMLENNVYSFRLSDTTFGKDDMEVFASEFLTYPGGFGITPDQWERLKDALEDEVFPAAFDVFAVGSGWDEVTGFNVTVAYQYPDPSIAGLSLPRVKEYFETGISPRTLKTFSDLFEVMEFRVEGRTVVAKLSTAAGAGTAETMVNVQPLHLHE